MAHRDLIIANIPRTVPNSYMQFIVSIEQKGLGLREGGVSSEVKRIGVPIQ